MGYSLVFWLMQMYGTWSSDARYKGFVHLGQSLVNCSLLVSRNATTHMVPSGLRDNNLKSHISSQAQLVWLVRSEISRTHNNLLV